MAEPITLTAGPTLVGSTSTAALWSAQDVSAHDLLDIEVSVVAWQSSFASLSVKLITGFQRESYDDWMEATSAIVLTAATPSQKVQLVGSFYRYLAWKVTALSGVDSVVIFIRGTARTTES
jgi:hypothetical protein